MFEYDYEEMKSSPIIVNLNESQMLKLQYPLTSVTHSGGTVGEEFRMFFCFVFC